MQEILQGLKEIGPWIISFLALLQVWIIELYRKLRKGKLDYYKTHNLEIGLTGNGPTLAFFGTIRCQNADIFVTNIRAKVIRIKDNSSHNFEWLCFRPPVLYPPANEPVHLEMASGFLLTPNQPFKFCLVLVDKSFSTDVLPKLNDLTKMWLDYYFNEIDSMVKAKGLPKETLLSDPSLAKMIHSNFSKKPEVLDVYTHLNRFNYWHSGDYQLQIAIDTSDSFSALECFWNFKISDEDQKRIETNSATIISIACNQQSSLNFINCDYVESKNLVKK